MRIEGNTLIAECTAYDFKKTLERKKIRDWLKSISAFANGYGGSLYYGVADSGEIIGLDDIKAVTEFISEKIKAHLDPVPRFQLIPYEMRNGVHIVEVAVEAGDLTPYYLFLDGSRMAYIRVGDESVPADSHHLLDLVLRGSNRSWDALSSTENIADHSFKLLADTYNKRTDTVWNDTLLESFGLVNKDGILTNGGLLFSDSCNIYQSRVFCTRWAGLSKGDALNDSEYSGNLLYLLQMATGFVKSNTAKRWFKLPEYRLNFPEYSERAILESCVNHLIHRDMTVSGSEVHIDIFDNRIEFYSPGGMVDGTKIQDRNPERVPSKRRNPIIADVFTQLNFMEKRGSGLRKIRDLTEELKSYSPDKKPYFESDASSFFTIIPNVNYGLNDDDFAHIIEKESIIINPGNTPPKELVSTPKAKISTLKEVKSTPKRLRGTAQAVIDILIEDPYIKRDELAERLGLKLEGVKYQLGQLQKKGHIYRDGGRKHGKWKVLIKK